MELYPEGGPGRQMKSRMAQGEVLVGGMITEYVRPSLVKLYKHAGFDFVYIEYEHTFFGPAELADTVLCARDNGLPVVAKTPQLERAEVAQASGLRRGRHPAPPDGVAGAGRGAAGLHQVPAQRFPGRRAGPGQQ